MVSVKGDNARVVIASEYPQRYYFLRGIVEGGGKAVTVGQAEDASQALAMARTLKPDIVIIDYFLPYFSSWETDNPLSRIAGLDIAQTISEEIPNIRVILLSNLDSLVLGDAEAGSTYSIVSQGVDIPFVRQDLSDKLVPPKALIFADIGVKATPPGIRETSLWDKIIFFGALGIAAGWLLTLTVMFALPGAPLALGGIVTLLVGLTGKLTRRLWHKFHRGEP